MQDILSRAEDYRLGARKTARGHYLTSKAAERKHLWLGVPVVVTTTSVGTALFATLSENPHVG